jgi:hypothetical protein
MELRPIELEVCTGSCTIKQVVEIDVRATLSQMVDIARELVRNQKWQKARVGVGSIWSNWITNNQN